MRCHPLFLALALAASAAQAHDTWFHATPARPGAALELHLGTGNRYPVQETGVGAEYLERQGCRSTNGEKPMRPVRDTERALVLQAGSDARSCWAQLVPLDIQIKPNLVAVYLKEIQAPAWVHKTWSQQQAQGLPWKERYTKHARIDLGASATTAEPVPLGMDILRQTLPDGSLRFRLLRGGQALAGQPMELIAQNSSFGIWRRSDEQGFIQVGALPAGPWVLRGTVLQIAADDPTRWDSDFVTLAFEVSATPLKTAQR
jgi:hypothetical protein